MPSSSDKNAAVAVSTPASLVAAVYKKKKKQNTVAFFLFSFRLWFFRVAFASIFHPQNAERLAWKIKTVGAWKDGRVRFQ